MLTSAHCTLKLVFVYHNKYYCIARLVYTDFGQARTTVVIVNRKKQLHKYIS